MADGYYAAPSLPSPPSSATTGSRPDVSAASAAAMGPAVAAGPAFAATLRKPELTPRRVTVMILLALVVIGLIWALAWWLEQQTGVGAMDCALVVSPLILVVSWIVQGQLAARGRGYVGWVMTDKKKRLIAAFLVLVLVRLVLAFPTWVDARLPDEAMAARLDRAFAGARLPIGVQYVQHKARAAAVVTTATPDEYPEISLPKLCRTVKDAYYTHPWREDHRVVVFAANEQDYFAVLTRDASC